MHPVKAFFAAAVLCRARRAGRRGAANFGAQGAEGEPNRLQQWLVPSPDPDIAGARRAVSPAGRRAVSARGDRACFHPERACVARKCRSRNTARWRRGWWRAALPCWFRSGRAMAPPAENISRTRAAATRPTMPAPAAPPRTRSRPRLGFVRKQPFIRPDGIVVIGHSAGGWGALALAGEDPKDVAAIIAFAPGRGGHANDFPNQVCAPHTLIAAAGEFGKGARVPVTWLVAGQRQLFFARAVAATGGRVPQRRRQGRFSRAAGLRQRGPLAAGNRRRCKTAPQANSIAR